jgi:release factor glutamine methyltransferase
VAIGSPLAPEITEFEPAGALFAGADGLSVIRRLIPRAAAVLLLALEIAPGQGDAVSGLMRAAGFGGLERRRDLAGHERVVIGRR